MYIRQAIIDDASDQSAIHTYTYIYTFADIYIHMYIRQAIIDDASDQSALAKDLRLMLKLTQMLRAKRVARGALSLASPEVCVCVCARTSAYTYIHAYICIMKVLR